MAKKTTPNRCGSKMFAAWLLVVMLTACTSAPRQSSADESGSEVSLADVHSMFSLHKGGTAMRKRNAFGRLALLVSLAGLLLSPSAASAEVIERTYKVKGFT